MKKLFTLALVVCVTMLQAKTIYLNPGDWAADGASFFAHSWTGNDQNVQDVKMNPASGAIYSADVPDDNGKVIFVRMPGGSTTLNWDSKWNQTGDLDIPADKNQYNITGWGDQDGNWSVYVDPAVNGYFIAGEGLPGVSWGNHVQMPGDSIVFADLAAGTYKFKVTTGNWDGLILGISAVDESCSTRGFSGDNDGNIVVRFAQTGSIKVRVVSGRLCITVTGATEEIVSGTGVPDACPDVLLQGFYYDSYSVDSFHMGTEEYGDTRWKTLLAQAGEIGAYFDLIWLPPSGLASGVGYHPRQYCNQNSDWGTRAELENLIAAFHNSGTKVVADIVINHAEAMSGWCDMAIEDFGEYGVFEPGPSYITSNDEVNQDFANVDSLAGDCWGYSKNSRADDGENWDAARDWAHDNPEVQEMFKAYLKWMKNVMKYDGWRYDKGDGYNNWHMHNYNMASEPYIAFEERYDGNAENLKNGIRDAQMNMMALDFALKFSSINAFQGWNYMGRGGLIGPDNSGSDYWKRHAVTWVDNHDMFLREDNDLEFCGRGNSMKPEIKARLLGANAFILSMPGVPCVFYPHWFKYKAEIKDMINARHLAGVHSESEVKDEEWDWDEGQGRNKGYKATIVGKNGWLILCLGTKTGGNFDGFTKVASLYSTFNNNGNQINESYEMWVKATGDAAPGLMVTPSAAFEDSVAGIDVTIQAVGGSGNAVIYYTTDGTDPTTASAQYSAPLNFKQTTTLKVMAACGSAQSKVQTYTYTYREPLKRGIQVRFNKPAEWEKAYVFAWIPTLDEKGNTIASENIMGAFPGRRIYQDVDGWYTCEFDNSLSEVNFQINSGDDCGGVNVKSNDLKIDYDACYGWYEGKAEESKQEVLLDCEAVVLHPEFDMIIAPESGYFRDQAEGQLVTLRAIGAPNAIIYYTTDGSEPSSASKNAQGEVSFTVNQTTTVKAYAQLGQQRTETYAATYTYKAPQQGAMTVRFIKPEDWEDLYIYAFTRLKTGNSYKDTPYALDGKNSKWPGIKWTQTDGIWHTYTMPESLKEIYVIFNIGSNETQTQDIYLAENSCFVWNPDCGRAVLDSNCDGEKDAVELIKSDDAPELDLLQPMYNVLGQRIGEGYTGIVIQNGHKYLIIQ